MKKRPMIPIAVLSSLALFVALGLMVSAVAQEPPAAAINDSRIYLPGVFKMPPVYALQFDGVDDFASIADKGDFDFEEAFTVEAWVKPFSVTGPVRRIVTGQRSPQPWPLRGWGIEQGSYDPGYWVCWACSGELPSVHCLGAASGHAERLQAGVWHHLAGTYDGTGVSIYQNGLLANRVYHWGDVTDVSFVHLGSPDPSFDGLLDEVRVWNVARTESEIQADMNRTLRGDEPGLVGYWRLDEGSGQAILDTSSHSNHGRLGSTSGPDGDDPTWVVSDAPIQ